MRTLFAALIGALCFARAASAQTPPAAPAPPPAKDAVPDLAFLEYLGSWQGDDDEWLAIKEWHQDKAPKKDATGEHKEQARDAARNGHDESE